MQKPEAAFSPYALRRFTVEEYHKLIEIGVLKSGDPYELLEGWIVRKMPITPRHAQAVTRLAYALFQLLPRNDWSLRTQQPVTTDDSEPEPDLVVAIGGLSQFDDRHPNPLEAELLIEVAQSSLALDRGRKLALYAAAKVPQYWIVNLKTKVVEIYTQPRRGKTPTYKARVDYVKGQDIPLVLAGKSVGSLPVSEFLA